MSRYFPTFARLTGDDWPVSPWLATPWWPADTLVTKQQALLRLLTVAAADRLEAAPLVLAAAHEERGSYRRRLRRFARRLSAGTGLADALEQTPGILSDEQALAIRFGEQSGMLPATLRTLSEQQDDAPQRITRRLRQIGFYAQCMFAIYALVTTFILTKIIPSFRAIFQDFAITLPNATTRLINLSNWSVQYWWLIAIIVIVILWLLRSQRTRRYFRRKISSRILRPIAQLRTADLLRLLSQNTRAGRPLAGALSTLARYHFDDKIRQKLLYVRNEIEQGASPWQSMAKTRLLTPQEATALERSTSAQSRAWSMEQLAALRHGEVERRIDTAISLFQPAVILTLAAVVTFIAVACLLPVFNLTSALT